MPTFNIPEYRVHIDQLKPGVFIRMESLWFNHPFLFNRFKIKNVQQIQMLRDAGIEEVICVPSKSDALPSSQKPAQMKKKPKEEKAEKDPATEEMWKIKQQRIEKLKAKRKEIARCEEKYQKSIANVPTMLNGIISGSTQAVEQAHELVDEMVATFMDETDAVVHLMESKATEEGMYFHALNVSVLALMIGKEMKFSTEQLKDLGMGALFHDVGKCRIEKKILRKPPPFTKLELQIIHLHPKYGVEIALKAKTFSNEALKVIFQHHERMNGKGYPKALNGSKISLSARIAAIADMYDNLVNNPSQAKALTPYQALSYMFAKQKNFLDMNVLSSFIRCIGIYPPGTIVQLSNDVLAIVIAVNPDNPLKPSLLIYDPEIPKDEAIIFGMEEDPELDVVRSIAPYELPPEIFRYLNPRTQLNYFVDTPGEGPAE
ncbi:MAG: HD-GYP domain-containing protein [Desulfovibrio sp.]|uniref:HD-GYP domain-containing protein n=1 Tax=Desulfovibrio sp. 7SRBS1 TaxID=3378064 RepID=UPI003B420DB9